MPALGVFLRPPAPAGGFAGSDAENVRSVSAASWLSRYQEMVMMIDLLERLPDLVDDIRDWPNHARVCDGAKALVDDRLPWTPRSPIAMRAFVAVGEGLDALSAAAVAACGLTVPPCGEAIATCQGIGAKMRCLLERALALVGDAEETAPGAAQTRTDFAFLAVPLRD